MIPITLTREPVPIVVGTVNSTDTGAKHRIYLTDNGGTVGSINIGSDSHEANSDENSLELTVTSKFSDEFEIVSLSF